MKKSAVLFAVFLMSFSLLAQRRLIKVVYIGDSITAGSRLQDAATQAAPVIASRYLRQQPSIDSVVYVNKGRSGFTTVDFLPGSATFTAVEDAATGLKAGEGMLIFSIMLGTNDSAISGPNGAPLGPDAYIVNLKTITDRLLQDFPGCRVVLNLPPWYSPNTYNRSQYLQEGLNRLQSYFKPVRKLVGSYHHQQVFLGDTGAFNFFKTHYLTKLGPETGHEGTFYLHPNKEGAADLGVLWGKALYKVAGEK